MHKRCFCKVCAKQSRTSHQIKGRSVYEIFSLIVSAECERFLLSKDVRCVHELNVLVAVKLSKLSLFENVASNGNND